MHTIRRWKSPLVALSLLALALAAALALVDPGRGAVDLDPPVPPPLEPGAAEAKSAPGLRVVGDPALALETVASGLDVPWALAFAPDGRIFITERPGRIRVVEGGRLRERPWAGFDAYGEDVGFKPESGLMGIALAPDFATTGHVYVLGTFHRAGSSRLARLLHRVYRKAAAVALSRDVPVWENRVYRLTDREGRAAEPVLVVDGLPANHHHAGGALAFGPDGMLYLTIGDTFAPAAAREPSGLAGTVLRFRPDGGVPADNPVPGSPVYARGFRNVQGLAWHPQTGDLFAIEHGPSGLEHERRRTGHDELNLIRPGADYGWPEVVGEAGDARYRAPLAVWTPAIAPGGAAFFAGGAEGGEASLFVTGLRGQQLRRVSLVRDGGEGEGWRVAAEEVLVAAELGRLRAIAVGPDGHLYLATSNRDGRGRPASGDDRLFRLVTRP